MTRHNGPQLDRFFRQPPKGGNATGVQTEHQMGPRPTSQQWDHVAALPGPHSAVTGPPAPSQAAMRPEEQGLRAPLNRGMQAAHTNAESSDKLRSGDFRNVVADRSPSAPVDQRPDPRGGIAYPDPQMRPATDQRVRSDGKPRRGNVDPDPTR